MTTQIGWPFGGTSMTQPNPSEPLTSPDAPRPLLPVGTVLERGIVPCRKCKRPHDQRITEAATKHVGPRRSWAADDGHAYERMRAEEVVRFLDAARSASPDPLAAALDVQPSPSVIQSAYESGLRDARAALSQPEPLDVERLARALDSHNHVGLPSEVIIACGRGRLDGCAPNIAAEYARLSETPRSGVSELIGE